MKALVLGVDDSLVDGIPTSGGDTPIIGGVLVAVDSHLSSFDFFVSIDTHGVYFLFVYILDNQFVIAISSTANVLQRYKLFSYLQNIFAPAHKKTDLPNQHATLTIPVLGRAFYASFTLVLR